MILSIPGVGRAAEECAANPDWPNLAAYRVKNAELGAPAKGDERVVFMGDSITEFWDRTTADLFANKAYVNRGISGQTSPQMLLRFRQDVIDLDPAMVVILAGTNDIAGNTGPAPNEMIEANIASMAELAKVHGIKVVLSSVPPASGFRWAPEINPRESIAALNKWIEKFSRNNGFVYLDYYSTMVDAGMGIKQEYSDDGVHPNAAGYKTMNGLVEKALATARGSN
jgi:lysophospholipase L1-like esterase